MNHFKVGGLPDRAFPNTTDAGQNRIRRSGGPKDVGRPGASKRERADKARLPGGSR